MKCDLCDKPAVVHEVQIKGGVKREVHLCEDHARKAGVTLPGEPINQLVTKFVISKPGEKGAAAAAGGAGATRSRARQRCANCGLTFAQFRQSGLLGCPDCYESFNALLAPMIERSQAGAVSHVGKCPQQRGEALDRQLRTQRLIRDLEEAVAAEQYERAARLRDRLRAMRSEAEANGSGADAGPAGTQPSGG